MNKKDLKSLEEALKKAPNNIALRLTYALKLFKLKDFDNSEKNYQAVLKLDHTNSKAKQGLVELYFVKENYSAVIIIAEELVKINAASEKMMELFAKALLRQNNIAEAQEVYERIISNNPFYYDEELDSVLEDQDEYLNGEDFGKNDDDYDGDDFDDFFDNPFLADETHLYLPESTIDFESVVGMQVLKDLCIYKTNKFEQLAAGSQMQKFSLLLYGPPGCGKTFFVKALASEIDLKVLPVGIDRLQDVYSYKMDGLLHYYFGKMRISGPTVLYIDEVDRFTQLRRTEMSQESRQIVTKFAEELDGIRFQDQTHVIIASTNVPWEMDPTFFTAGKFNYPVFCGPPTQKERVSFIKLHQKLANLEIEEINTLAGMTKDFSYAELNHMFDLADVYSKLGEVKSKKKVKPTYAHFDLATKNIYPSARAWFQTFVEKWPKALADHPVSTQVMNRNM